MKRRSNRFLSRVARAAGMRTAFAAILVLNLAACGGDDSGGSTPTQPSGPNQAAVTVTYSNFGWLVGGFPGATYSIQFTITIRETAGLGIKGNFLRADFYPGANGTGGLIERQEVGGNILGRLAGGASETENLVVGFNAGATASVVLTFNATDDRGNVLVNSQTFNCC